jgi:hypothetical protein
MTFGEFSFNFAIGVVTGVMATAIYEEYKHRQAVRRYKALRGWWLEDVPTAAPHSTRCGAGRFSYSRVQKRYVYMGYAYDHTGHRTGHWESEVMDIKGNNLHYTYSYYDSHKPEAAGFGGAVMRLDDRGCPIVSVFIDAEGKNARVPVKLGQVYSLDALARRLSQPYVDGDLDSIDLLVRRYLESSRPSPRKKT